MHVGELSSHALVRDRTPFFVNKCGGRAKSEKPKPQWIMLLGVNALRILQIQCRRYSFLQSIDDVVVVWRPVRES
jgi:hypothetical protein